MHGSPYFDEVLVDLGPREQSTVLCGSGPPLLLLHGYPFDKRLWSRALPLLAPSFLCIAPDMRGFGRQPEERFSFSIADLADDCALLLSRLQIQRPAMVCGLSMGGYVAMEFVRRHREKTGAVICPIPEPTRMIQPVHRHVERSRSEPFNKERSQP